MRKKIKKSIALPAALFLYTTVMAIYFIPRNHEMGSTEKWVTVIASYLIIIALWWLLDKKEKMMKKRDEELEKQEKANK